MATRSSPNTRGAAQRWHFGGPGRSLVTLTQIRGEAFVSMDLMWPALIWNEGRCWSYLHDLAPAALRRVMEELRKTDIERRAPHGPITW